MTRFREEKFGDSRVILGDAIEILPTLGGADAIITDPPYAIPTQVAAGRTIARSVGDLSIVEAAFRQYADAWKRLVSDRGRVFVFCDGASYPVIYRALYGQFTLASLIWDKGQIGMGREFRKQHELIIHAWGGETVVAAADGTGYSDVLRAKPVPVSDRVHPAEKPIALISQLLRVCGQTILDPFMGSGSTGVAAISAGKRFIGIEIDQGHFDTACKRLDALSRQGDLLAVAS